MSKLATVTYQTTEYVRDHCLCLAAQRVARTLARRFDEALRPVGLTSGQFSLLMALNRPAPPNLGSDAGWSRRSRRPCSASASVPATARA